MSPPRTILTIAGSDPSGGAGLQADLATFRTFGARGLSVVTAVTAQNERRFLASHPVPGGVVSAQLQAVAAIGFDAVKIGMLATGENVAIVAKFLAEFQVPVVLDPVLGSSTGAVLLDDPGALDLLYPLVTLVTPNRRETGLLSIPDENFVLAKGLDDPVGVADELRHRGGVVRRWVHPRSPGDPHGTGCALASAVACGLADGVDLEGAADSAIDHVQRLRR